MARFLGFSSWPGLSVTCACGTTMSLAKVTPHFNLGETHEYACGSCGYHHIVECAVQPAAGALWTPPEEPKDPEPEPDVPVIHGSVIGYRAWRIRDWQLYGTGVNRAWVPGVNEATCDTGPPEEGPYGRVYFSANYGHSAPAEGCACGITALARFKEQDNHWSNADVFGAIEAWSDETVDIARPGDGYISEATANVIASRPVPLPEQRQPGRFILHGTGFRAKYGKIVLLAVDDDWPVAKTAAVRALAREHEADVCKHAHLEDAAKEHGQLVPDDMLAWAEEGNPAAEVAGGYLSQSLATLAGQMQVSMQSLGLSVNQARSSLGWPVLPPPKRKKGPRPTGKPGICQTLWYNGPPSHGKYRKNQRVRDRGGDTWRCARGGQPGTWEREEA